MILLLPSRGSLPILYSSLPHVIYRRTFIVIVIIDVAARWPSGTPQGRPLLPSTTLLQPGDPNTSPVRHIIMSHSKIHSRTVPIQNIALTRGGKKHVSAQHRLNRFVQDPTLISVLTERCKDLLQLVACGITSVYLHTGVSSQDMCWQRIVERVTIKGRFLT